MIPIVSVDEMRAVDAAAPEPVATLVERAGRAVAWTARRMLGGVYGRRVVVLAGPGNNGADGRVAAERLRAWGAHVTVVDATIEPPRLPEADLVIDAAYGTGISRPWKAPETSARVLAVDIPSGVTGDTGEVIGSPLRAECTITFQALKPGLLFEPGATYAGEVEVVDIGLDLGQPRAHRVDIGDVRRWFPRRSVDAHKWHSACWVIAGSPAMTGAAELTAAAAARTGSGYVRLSVPGVPGVGPIEAVKHSLPSKGWGGELSEMERFGALVLGPGLGRSPWAAACVRETVASCTIPMLVDGDGLNAIGGSFDDLRARALPAVLTPHDGEFNVLQGQRPGADRLAAARDLADATGAVVLLKGPTTVVADPGGRALVCTRGDQRLATAGSGDVLSGVIGALLARHVDPFEAAAAGAWIHGRAAELQPLGGVVASDLLPMLPHVLTELLEGDA